MTSGETFDALCERAGIEPAYIDQSGVRQQTPDEIRRALLEAMGIDPDRPTSADDPTSDGRLLPPVKVVRDDTEPIRLEVRLPADGPAQLEWRLVLEDGTIRSGRLSSANPGGDAGATADAARTAQIELPLGLPLGYHQLTLAQAAAPDVPVGEMRLIVCPRQCYQPAFAAADGRVFGIAAQLYTIRSRRNWGIGDYTDLAALVELAAASGAGLVGVNPLHALFPHEPEAASPYSPSNRSCLNVLYLDVEAIPEFDEADEARALVDSEAFRARLDALRATRLVDYRGVAAAKFEVLELLWRHFRSAHADSARAREFAAFCSRGGDELHGHALYDALQQHFFRDDPAVWGWPAWPEAYRDRESPEVARFAREHRDRVDFFLWLQWLAESQLAAAQQRARALGMPVGLYRDLAVGVNSSGSETWIRRDLFALETRVGAPPDLFNLLGQDWGLPPEVPARLTADGYRKFSRLIRANMRHAGALRIDHVMGLMRLYWVPPGRTAAQGGYVRYPFDDLAGIVALESQRARCIVIGEDLGVVPEKIHAAMRDMRMLSYRPLYFERDDDGAFRAPDGFPRMALSAVSTHDLPTLRGFWRGADIETRHALGLFPDDATRNRSIVERARDRAQLLIALERAGLLPEGRSADPMAMPDADPPFVQAVHAYLARTPTMLMVIQPDDIFEHLEQVNLPGTTESMNPNWRLRLAESLEDWADDPRYRRLVDAVVRERGRAPLAGAGDAAAGFRVATIPRATYRLQLHREFGFAQAARIVPYLAALGVSHVYSSPFLKARPGSTHGYDIVDHNSLNPELGTAEDFTRYTDALREHGLSHLVDIVPNHMGVLESDNAWWLDVLENGPASQFAGYFDIDWEPASPLLRDKVLVPVLGDQYGAVLDQGELRLEFDAAAGEFSIHYYGHRFPVDPGEYPRILSRACARLTQHAGIEPNDAAELQSLVSAFGHLPGRGDTAPERVAERRRDKEVHKRRLAVLCERSETLRALVEEAAAAFNGTPGDPASFEALHQLLEAQAFRLAFWRVASDDINYRRFFDINDLAGLRMESDVVFEHTHRLLFRLIDEGRVHGLRIDHPDGLRDPLGYFERLQRHCGGPAHALGSSGDAKPMYLVVEKILAEKERLPSAWPVHGTTGYRFANLVNGLFVDRSARERFDRLYRSFAGARPDYEEEVYRAKKLIMRTSLSSEFTALANTLHRIAGADRHTRDFTVNSLRAALAEIVAHFPVYRTYIVVGDTVSEPDRRYIRQAVAAAKRSSHEADLSAIDFIAGLLDDAGASVDDPQLKSRIAWFIGRFQQYTAPVTAKSMEDTAFYRYNRLVSLNEVGGEPSSFGLSVDAFHEATAARMRQWPHTMLATSTHDTKRGEDARMRIDVLTEMPAAWRLALRRWRGINARLKHDLDGVAAPSANDEYLLYQALLAIWPHDDPDAAGLASLAERLDAYMLKAIREAKVHTSWLNPYDAYEKAVAGFVAGLLDPAPDNPFLAEFVPFARTVGRFGIVNSLAQTAIKLASPGVPDIYQGSELWNLSLVDPDNRRPVDYDARMRMLAQLSESDAADPAARRRVATELFESAHDGRLKLWTIGRMLALRAQTPELFERGSYLPLQATGDRAEHVVAFGRVHGDHAVIVVAPRLPYRLAGSASGPVVGADAWRDTRIELAARLPQRRYRDLLTGAELDGRSDRRWMLATLLEPLPFAVIATAES